MSIKRISTLALVALLTFGASTAFASEVTGGLTSSGVATPANSGTLSGTVSQPSSGGSAGSSGGGGGGGNFNFASVGTGGGATTQTTQGQVLGASTGITPNPNPAGSGGSQTQGTVGTDVPTLDEDVLALAVDGTVTTQTAPTTETSSEEGFQMEVWMWLVLLLVAGLLGYYAYSRRTRTS